MSRAHGDGAEDPLPRDWLPQATPLEGTPAWEALLSRVVAAVDPAGRGLGPRAARVVRPTWPAVLGSWWRPAAVLAAAAAAMLVLLDPTPAPSGPGDGALPLSLVAAGGQPVALLEGLGIPADPVLALIALEARP
jgi:hypothetical protein